MDSHITGDQSGPKPAYTELMGHLDLGECLKLIVYMLGIIFLKIILVTNGFNIYFPILIVLLCTGTWFKLGTRCLSSIGFAQFLQSDELTSDLMEEGKAFVNRGNFFIFFIF